MSDGQQTHTDGDGGAVQAELSMLTDGKPAVTPQIGSGQTRLTKSGGSDSWPAWSPDGEKVAFSSVRDGNIEIHVMNADGSGQTNSLTNSLTNDPASGYPVTDGFAAWSPVP